MGIKTAKTDRFLRDIFAYFSIVIFVLWVSSVIESFIPLDSRWLMLASQAFFVIKVTFVAGLIVVPILLFLKDPLLIRIGLVTILIILIRVLLVAGTYE